jgi:hypothetical protein
VETEVCTHHFDYNGGLDIDWVANSNCWDDVSGTFTGDIVDMPGLGRVKNSTFSHCGSLLAVSADQSFTSRDGAAAPADVTIYDMKTMSLVQRVTVHGCTSGPIHTSTFSPEMAKGWSLTLVVLK